MKAIFIAGLGAALVASSTYAQQTQVVGQPVLRAPAPMAPEDLRNGSERMVAKARAMEP